VGCVIPANGDNLEHGESLLEAGSQARLQDTYFSSGADEGGHVEILLEDGD
jgi:hypothetical protein